MNLGCCSIRKYYFTCKSKWNILCTELQSVPGTCLYID